MEVGTFRGFLFCSLKTGWANAHPAPPPLIHNTTLHLKLFFKLKMARGVKGFFPWPKCKCQVLIVRFFYSTNVLAKEERTGTRNIRQREGRNSMRPKISNGILCCSANIEGILKIESFLLWHEKKTLSL